jgi:uncharacterized protein (DUF885 family)
MEDALLDRRSFLASSAAFGLFGFAGAAPPAFAQQANDGGSNARDRALDALLTGWFNEDISENPTFATGLGLDTGERAALRGRLGDDSQAKADADRIKAVRRAHQLQAFGRAGLSPAGQLNYDIAAFRGEVGKMGAHFHYGNAGGRPAPYVVSQLGGAYYQIPDFLDTQHPIHNAEDADYYIARLEAFAANLDQESERIRHDAALHVTPPDFILDKTIANLERLRATPAAETTLVRSLARRAAEAHVEGDHAARAAALVSGPIAAALDRQIAALRALRSHATHAAGTRRLPDGEAYYAWGLRANTTTAMTGDEIHRLGLAQVAEIQGRLDPLLRAQGFSQGTVGARINALNVDPRSLYPNTDEGRAALLAYLNEVLADIRPRLPRMFNTIPRAELRINRVPPAIEAGAPGGYYQGGPLDGSRPGIYYINLKDTAEWPRMGLKTLTYHEGIPGHHFQISLARESGSLPIYRRAGGFSAYSEGWALYAERLGDELGCYEGDPLGRIGYLQSYLFRAVRLVVDSGLHAKGWSREQAIRYMIDNAAEPEGSAVREIERYCVWPGQACAYKSGQTVIAGLRDEAEQRLGGRFDLKAFHDAVLNGGALPLTVLQRRVREWMTA